jgi:hypothetical protein
MVASKQYSFQNVYIHAIVSSSGVIKVKLDRIAARNQVSGAKCLGVRFALRPT